MSLETKDKNFNSTTKILGWSLGCVITIITLTISVTKYIKSEMNETVKTSIQIAIAELLYEVKDFKEVKLIVQNNDKLLSLLTYRIGAVEDKLKMPTISKDIRAEELNREDQGSISSYKNKR